MKTLILTRKYILDAGRWDIDFHLPAEGIKTFPADLLGRVDQVADIAREKRDPGRTPELPFQYIDIAAVDVTAGVISNAQDMEGSEAPSRARKVIQAFDVIVSTCRPTRGAIAVVPPRLHNQIASTAFSILRPKPGVNPFYLQYALRLPSTLEQFRKWSTGSSYPAILDSDVKKTKIPVPAPHVQDEIAEKVMIALRRRADTIKAANSEWSRTLKLITSTLAGHEIKEEAAFAEEEEFSVFSIREIEQVLSELPEISADNGNLPEEEQDLLSELVS